MTVNTLKERRFAVIVQDSVQTEIAALAKEHGVTQSIVIKALIEVCDKALLADTLKAKKQEKLAGRTSKSALLKRLAAMDSEKLKELLRQMD